MATAEVLYRNGKDKARVDFQPAGMESPAERAVHLWRDIGLVWKGIAAALALGLLAWNLGVFAISFRITALERADAAIQADVGQLRADVTTLRIDMASVKTDVASIKEGLKGFKGEVLAEIRAGVSEMKQAASQTPTPTAHTRAASPAPQVPARAAKRARVAKKEPAPPSWLPLWNTQ